ncbi:MAG TPA: carbohydrate kinase [Candidatus Sulfotelmatobacter sp.]|nr:carbohydrate kinase [Candidatus Sulfotelmatobacter sp.]
MKKKVVGLGEVLWDILPERTCLGGAPANFAYITTLMGDHGIVASCTGEDSLGVEALRRLEELGLDIDHVQTDRVHPTGTVNVKVDGKGIPHYEIAHPVAWDFLHWTLSWQHLAEKADAVCFGSLAQRSEQSRATIRRFVSSASPGAAKIFDVNLRQSYYSREVLTESMRLADIVKLNDEELPKIMSLIGLPQGDEQSSAQRLVETYDLKLVCVTRGGRGSLLVQDGARSEHPGFRVKVADTVGSGDAFTAGLVHEYLHGASMDLMNEVANLVGAWVASEVGAMPTPKRGALEYSLAEIR